MIWAGTRNSQYLIQTVSTFLKLIFFITYAFFVVFWVWASYKVTRQQSHGSEPSSTHMHIALRMKKVQYFKISGPSWNPIDFSIFLNILIWCFFTYIALFIKFNKNLEHCDVAFFTISIVVCFLFRKSTCG